MKNKVVNKFSQLIKNSIKISKTDVEELKAMLHFIYQSKNINEYLNTHTLPTSESILQCLADSFKIIERVHFNAPDANIEYIKIYLENLFILKNENLSSFFTTKYINDCIAFKKKIEDKYEIYNEYLAAYNFQCIAKMLDTIDDDIVTFQDYFNLESKKDSMLKELNQSLQNKIDNFKLINRFIDRETMSIFISTTEIFRNAKTNQLLIKFIPNIKELFDALIQKLLAMFESVYQRSKTALTANERQQYMVEIELLREIPEVQYMTTDRYIEVQNQTNVTISDTITKIDENLELSPELINYSTISRQLRVLERLKEQINFNKMNGYADIIEEQDKNFTAVISP
jgi:hypothetical protein